jgi:hypothetical protein
MTRSCTTFFFVLLLLCLCTDKSKSEQAPTPVWQDILVNDCVGGFHILPSSPFAVHIDTTTALDIIKAAVKEITEKARCQDSTISEHDVLCKFVPSLEMAMAAVEGANTTEQTRTTEKYDGFPRFSFWDKRMPIMRNFDKYGTANVLSEYFPDITNLFPTSCDPAEFKNGQACKLQIPSNKLGIKVGMILKQCPDKSKINPYFAITCSGELCSNFGKPCSADSDCGQTGKCHNLPLKEDAILGVLEQIGLISARERNENDGFINKMAETLSQCIIDAKQSSLSTPWRLVSIFKRYVHSFFDAGPMRESADLNFCIPESSPEDIVRDISDILLCKGSVVDGSGCFSVDTRSMDYISGSCKANGCAIARVGDLICDPQCNNRECHWDGGDCDGDDRYITMRNLTGAAAFLFPSHEDRILPLNQPAVKAQGCRLYEDEDIKLCKLPWCDPDYKGFKHMGGDVLYLDKKDKNYPKNYLFIDKWGKIASSDVVDGLTCPSMKSTDDVANPVEATEIIIKWKTTVPVTDRFINSWDGVLGNGEQIESAKYTFGIKYRAPSLSFLQGTNDGQTLIKMGCRGHFGIGLGNGLSLRMKIPLINELSGLIGNAVKYVQSCRNAGLALADFSLKTFRTNWKFWDLAPYLYRFTQSYSGKTPKDFYVEADKKRNRPWGMDFLHGEFKLPEAKVWEKQLKTGWRFGVPDSCTWNDYATGKPCRVEFSGLKSILGTPSNVLFEARKCSDPTVAEGVPSFALVLKGAIGTMTTPIVFCEDNKDCSSGSVCEDMAALTNLDEVLKKKKLTASFNEETYETDEAKSPGDPSSLMEQDVMAGFVFGRRMAKPQCVDPKGSLKAIRSVVLTMGGGVGDGNSDLKICVVESLLDFGKIGDNALAYRDTMLKVSPEGKRLDFKDLMQTEESALWFGLDRYKTNGKKAAMKAQQGQTFQKFTIRLKNTDENFCGQQHVIKKGIVLFLKQKNPKTFMSLSATDVTIACDASARRLSSGRKLAVNNVDFYVECPEEDVTVLRQEIKKGTEDSSSLARALGEAGAVNKNGELLQPKDVDSVSVSETDAKEVDVPLDSIDPGTIEAIEEKKTIIAKEKREKPSPELHPAVFIGVGGVILIIIGALILLNGTYFAHKHRHVLKKHLSERFFIAIDKDGNGTLDAIEIQTMLEHEFGAKVSTTQVRRMMKKFGQEKMDFPMYQKFIEYLRSVDDENVGVEMKEVLETKVWKRKSMIQLSIKEDGTREFSNPCAEDLGAGQGRRHNSWDIQKNEAAKRAEKIKSDAARKSAPSNVVPPTWV